MSVSRFHVLDGRLPALDRADEVLVPELLAVTGWHVGDQVTDLDLFRLGDEDKNLEPIPSEGTPVTFTIMEEGRRVDEYTSEPDSLVPRIYLTPAFGRANPDAWFLAERATYVLADGSAGVAFRDEVIKLTAATPHAQLLFTSIATGQAFTQSALRPQVIALWLFAAVVLAGLVLVYHPHHRTADHRAAAGSAGAALARHEPRQPLAPGRSAGATVHGDRCDHGHGDRHRVVGRDADRHNARDRTASRFQDRRSVLGSEPSPWPCC